MKADINHIGKERERRLNEAVSRECSSIPIDSHEQYADLFANTITLIHFALNRGEIVSDLNQARQQFLEGISQIEFSSEEKARIQPIVDLAQGEWTPEVIKQLVEVEDKVFPGLSAQARQKMREEEIKGRR